MFSNVPNETMYFGVDFDSSRERLSGDKAYEVTFAAGQTPPVQGFWSLTLYNEQHFFAPNQLNRSSLGTKNKGLKENAVGTLTIYVQRDNPGADKESNWLPAAKGNFSHTSVHIGQTRKSSAVLGRHRKSRKFNDERSCTHGWRNPKCTRPNPSIRPNPVGQCGVGRSVRQFVCRCPFWLSVL
jgi:hypothetical protein